MEKIRGYYREVLEMELDDLKKKGLNPLWRMYLNGVEYYKKTITKAENKIKTSKEKLKEIRKK